MPVYTVHEPPLRTADAPPDPARFAFVRDGFSMWAFLLGPLWMVWHRMWLVLLGYALVAAGLAVLVKAFGASAFPIGLIGLLIALLAGLEAGTLRRFTLSRRGWRNVGIVCGDDREDAERRFFDAWLHKAASDHAAPAGGPSAIIASTAPIPRMPPTPDVIGLFPQPGAQR